MAPRPLLLFFKARILGFYDFLHPTLSICLDLCFKWQINFLSHCTFEKVLVFAPFLSATLSVERFTFKIAFHENSLAAVLFNLLLLGLSSHWRM